MSDVLKDRVAIVTGGSRGIGKAITEALLKEGATVIIGSRTKDQLDETIQEFSSIGKIDGYMLDVGERESVQSFVHKVEQTYNRIDILVNCAGVNKRLPLIDYPEEEWVRIININLHGSYRMAQEVGQRMIKNGGGNIINITSLMSHTVTPNQGPYAVSKAGLAQFTKLLAVEWAKYNIRVNAISPGYIETPLTKGVFENEEYKQIILDQTPQQRLGLSEHIAEAAVFLASDRASFITGQVMAVDGGFLAGYPNIVPPDA